MSLVNIDSIKSLASSLNLKPSASSGQNFLIDKDVLERIVAAADIKKGDNILEIGPGFGTLTEKLIGAKKVLAVEQDRRIFNFLRKKFANIHNLELKQGNILSLTNQEIKTRFKNEGFRVIANIPYSITGKIMTKFISDTSPKPENMTLLVQKEVAERICAVNKKMSLLAISVQLYSLPKIEFIVDKKSFWPIPKVDSALLKIDKISEKSIYPIHDIKFLWQILRVAFSSPRKQLHNNLINGFKLSAGRLKKALADATIDPALRAEDVALKKWVKLSNQGF